MDRPILSVGFYDGCFTHVQLVYDYGILNISRDAVERAAVDAFLDDGECDPASLAKFLKTLQAAGVNVSEILMIVISHDGEIRRAVSSSVIAAALSEGAAEGGMGE